MATDDQDDTTLPPNRAVVIGVSQYERDKSLVYCLEVFENEEFTGSPFRLYKEDGGYVWENKQLRLQKITLGSLIVFERKRTGNSSNHCYLENTKTIWDIDAILSKLPSSDDGSFVYGEIDENFHTAMNENGSSPVCALIGVKEATLVDRQIVYQTGKNETHVLKNNCRNNGSCGLEEVPLPVQFYSSNEGVDNCVLLVKSEFDSGLNRRVAICEAILAGPSPLDSYKMNKNPRGKCIIVNNVELKNIASDRDGAKADQGALETLFQELSFDVETHTSFEALELRALATKTAREYHKEYNALFFITMSHGQDHHKILCKDERSVTVEEIMSEFTAARCPALETKPKVFIFQVCGGFSAEVQDHGELIADSIPIHFSFQKGKSPREADFLLAFATTPGYYSYRDKVNGSPFIQTLVDVIKKYHQESHLVEMLSEVTKRVIEKPIKVGSQSYIQVPSNSNTLRFKLYL